MEIEDDEVSLVDKIRISVDILISLTTQVFQALLLDDQQTIINIIKQLLNHIRDESTNNIFQAVRLVDASRGLDQQRTAQKMYKKRKLSQSSVDLGNKDEINTSIALNEEYSHVNTSPLRDATGVENGTSHLYLEGTRSARSSLSPELEITECIPISLASSYPEAESEARGSQEELTQETPENMEKDAVASTLPLEWISEVEESSVPNTPSDRDVKPCFTQKSTKHQTLGDNSSGIGCVFHCIGSIPPENHILQDASPGLFNDTVAVEYSTKKPASGSRSVPVRQLEAEQMLIDPVESDVHTPERLLRPSTIVPLPEAPNSIQTFNNIDKRLSSFSNASTLVEVTQPATSSPVRLEPNQAPPICQMTVENDFKSLLKSKFRLDSIQTERAIQYASNQNLFRKNLCKFLLENYNSWHRQGIWKQDQYDLPESSSSDPVDRISCLIGIDRKNENGTAVNEARELIILHLLLVEFDKLEASLDNSVSRHKGQRAASAVIDKLEQQKGHDRRVIEEMLKRSRRFKRITDKLGLAIVLVGGPYLATLMRGSKITHDMCDCLTYYIATTRPHILKITEILDCVARCLLENVPWPQLETFQRLVEKVKIQEDKGQQSSFSTELWVDELNYLEASCHGVTARDVRTLLPEQHLNNVIVDCTLQLFADESRTYNRKTYVWDSSLFTHITAGKDIFDRTLEAGIKLFKYDIHLIPIRLEDHWLISQVDLGNHEITTYGSLSRERGYEQSIYMDLERWVDEACITDIPRQMAFRYISYRETPQQENEYESGIIMLWVASQILKNKTIDQQENKDWEEERRSIARRIYDYSYQYYEEL